MGMIWLPSESSLLSSSILQGAPGVSGTPGPVGDQGQRGRVGFPVSSLELPLGQLAVQSCFQECMYEPRGLCNF